MKREWNLPLLALLGVLAWSGSGAFSQSEYLGYSNASPSPWYAANPQVASSGELLLSSSVTPNGQQQIAIVDSKAKSLAIYQVHPESGAITLKSVRSIGADFGLDEYNGTEPSPTKVRAIQHPQ